MNLLVPLSFQVACLTLVVVGEEKVWFVEEKEERNCSSMVQNNPLLDNNEIRIAVQEYMNDPNSCEKTYGEIEYWNVQEVTNMFELFAWYQNTTNFNADLTCWNVSSVTDMTYMFAYANDFNGNVKHWDTRNVLYTTGMFRYATEFNRDISTWNIENASDTWGMFYGAQSFDQELCWNVSNVYTTDMMFYNSSGCIRPRCCTGCDEELLCVDSDDDDLFEEQ